jgi:hypothetical protein
MNAEQSLEARRSSFFARAKKHLEDGDVASVWDTELAELWPTANGCFDAQTAYHAFQLENLHWKWEMPHSEEKSV